ncbi:uncharacterized protein F4807DRAFT_77907 [Annulohypoxylon truncatum]|uniref:uncharacterized protein n=1 Tax=Annulohypoxylon truncatum TaxID=327061 RepID=UPI00200729D2|nr:uncharacterized protein F4807DRAFT_77907 [Annulohypoxylon truncatum]KAI1209900.1 hypothetical protein F4807DRAFT_77907 [Annulohypoxylon truncatum]
MDRTGASRIANTGRLGITRHPGLALAAVAATGIIAAVRYQQSAITRNEKAQKSSAENFYVSVDRSGGGI